MTPSSDKLSGENHAELVIFSATDIWNISISEQVNSSSNQAYGIQLKFLLLYLNLEHSQTHQLFMLGFVMVNLERTLVEHILMILPSRHQIQ